MVTQNFINALNNPQYEQWISANAQNFIAGGRGFQREVQLTNQLADLMPPNILSNGGGFRDFYDLNNANDVGEAAHNGSYQNASDGPEHLIKRFNQYVSNGLNGEYFGLMCLLDMRQIQPNTAFAARYHNDLGKCTPLQVENMLNQLPGGIVFQTQTLMIHSLEEPNTLFRYHFYVVNFQLSIPFAVDIRNTFWQYDWYNRTEFDNNWII